MLLEEDIRVVKIKDDDQREETGTEQIKKMSKRV